MAENKSQAQHLASLDFDISGIIETLKQVDEQTKAYGLQVGKNFSQSVQLGADQVKGAFSDFNISKIIDDEKLEAAQKSLEKFALTMGQFSRATTYQNGDKIFGQITFDDSAGKRVIAQYELVGEEWEKVTTKQTNDAKKLQAEIQKYQTQVDSLIQKLDSLSRSRERAGIQLTSESALKDNEQLISQIRETVELLKSGSITAEEAKKRFSDFSSQTDFVKYEESAYKKQQEAEKELQALKDSFYKKNISQIDFEISRREIEARKFSSQLQAQMEERVKQEREVQSLKDSFYKKNASQIDIEIAERERQAKVFSAQIKEQMTLRAKEEAEAKKVVAQIEKMIEKQKQFNTTVSNQRSSSVNKDILTQSNQYISGLEQLKSEIAETGKVSEQQKSQIASYSSRIKELSGYYQEAGTKGESFLQKISDKAKWLGAFYVVNELRQGFIETINIIRETEDAVVDLQRVLNDDKISQSKMSDELYNVAYEYGRTFEEVAEVSTQFAQAGYDWADTMELTRGTMLALNTAELDVTESTQGLIAIMSQWNLTAEDYADVVDKINITADNFAVNSENIVAALQRASSSARNANISLEQTIGIITALAEATGRSGENIGTALNSLIIYTSKAGALETFAKNGSDAMKEVVSEYQRGAVSIYEVWLQLSEELEHLTAAQQASLFNSEDYQEFANELESQAEEFTSQVSEIYGAAGTYRQNYFIALLNDMAKAEEAVRNMSDAEGYSLKENQKYMETLTANWNQLKAMLSELAVQLGEAGLMDFLKGITQTAISLTELTKSLGGIVPLMLSIGGAVLAIKSQKITESIITPITSGFEQARLKLSLFKLEMQSATTVSAKAKTAFSLLASSIDSIAFALGIATTAISLFLMVYNGISGAIEESRNKRIEANKAILDESKGINDLFVQYTSLSNIQAKTLKQEEEFESVNSKIVELLGDRAKALEGLTQGTNEYTEALKLATKEQLALNNSTLVSQLKQYEDALKSAFGLKLGKGIQSMIPSIYGDTKELRDIINETLTPFYRSDIFGAGYGPSKNDIESNIEYYKALVKTKEAMDEYASQSQETAEIVGRSEAYEAVQSKINELSDSVNKLIQAQTDLQINYILQQQGFPTTIEQYEIFKNQVIEATDETGFFSEQIGKLVDDEFPSLAKSASEAGNSIENSFSVSSSSIDELRDSIEQLSGVVDDFQSSFDSVVDAVNEYNESGYLSIDTVQKLLSLGLEYISVLNFTADGVSLNEQATRNLLSAQNENINKMFEQAAQAGVLEIQQKYLAQSISGTGDESETASPKVDNLSNSLEGIAVTSLNSAVSLEQFKNKVKEINGESVTGSGFDNMVNEMYSYIERLKQLRQYISTDLPSYSNSYYQSVNNAAKNASDAQIELLEEQKEAIKEKYDAEIEALKEVESENDRIRKKEEYYRNREEALKDIESASTRSGVEYREQEQEAREKLDELDREWQETLEDWSIEDKIAELEALRDAEIAALDAQIESLQQSVSGTASTMVNSFSNVNSQILSNYQTEYLEPAADKTKETYEGVSIDIIDIFGKTAPSFQELSSKNAQNMYSAYEKNFFLPMQKSIIETQRSFAGISVLSPNFSPFPVMDVGKYYSEQNIVNNNTKSSNMFANIYNNSGANTIFNNFFAKP